MGSHWKGTLNSLQWLRDGRTLTIAPRDLDIIWGKDRRYWNIPEDPKIREVELLQVCWLEVSRTIPCNKFQGKAGTYKVQFEVKLKPDAFGWSASPVYFLTKVGKNPYRWFKCSLSNQGKDGEPIRIPDTCEFNIEESQTSTNDLVTFGMYEIWRGKWKGGLEIRDVCISKKE